jgi:hypothetical protein
MWLVKVIFLLVVVIKYAQVSKKFCCPTVSNKRPHATITIDLPIRCRDKHHILLGCYLFVQYLVVSRNKNWFKTET